MPKNSNQKDDLLSRIQLREQVLAPDSWINQAEELIDASKKLKPSIKTYWSTTSKFIDVKKRRYSPPPNYRPKRLLQSTYFMLVAYAIENYFKAILIIDSESTFSDEILQTGQLPRELLDHKLTELAKKAKFNFTDAEANLLTKLSRNSTWQGRYPVPTNANQLISKVIQKGEPFSAAFLSPQEMNDLDVIIRRIKKYSSSIIKASQQ